MSRSHRDEFDRQFRRVTATVVVAWVVSAGVSLALLAVIVWAVIRLVVHFT